MKLVDTTSTPRERYLIDKATQNGAVVGFALGMIVANIVWMAALQLTGVW